MVSDYTVNEKVSDYTKFSDELRLIADELIGRNIGGKFGDDHDRLMTAAWLIERLRAIPVIERLPETSDDVLAWCKTHEIWEETCYHVGHANPNADPEYDHWTGEASCRYTHWLPMPPKPE